jgi:hypothetical protein
MAPEQARSEPIDPRADVYAIGLGMREALSGNRARPGGDREAILEAARRGMLLPWPHLAPAEPASPELALGSGDHGPADPATEEPPPAALVAIIDRATAATPADRYPDARSMLEDLDGFIVSQRAAQRVDAPARQLAAWLASVWDGARDDADADAAIEAEHLVSFLDDGAFDLPGAGTMRSMAATAADEPAAPRPPPPPAPAPPAPAPAPAPAIASPGRLPLRISSSTATIASGSFETLPASSDAKATTDPGARRRRPIAALASLVIAGIAIGAAVVAISNRRAKDSETPSNPTPSNPTASNPTASNPTASNPPPSSPAASNPTASNPTRLSSSTAGPAPSNPIPASSAPPGALPTKAPPARPTAQPAAPSPRRGQLAPASPGTQRRSDTATSDTAIATREGSATSGAPASGSGAARQTCRVRINLTPWAYYTADQDPTRHETPGTIDLAPGSHRLHVWNPELHVERDITISVPADRDTMNYSEPLQPSPPAEPRPSRSP